MNYSNTLRNLSKKTTFRNPLTLLFGIHHDSKTPTPLQPIPIRIIPLMVLETLQVLAVEAVAHRETDVARINEVVAFRDDAVQEGRKLSVSAVAFLGNLMLFLNPFPAQQFPIGIIDAIGIHSRFQSRNAHSKDIPLATDKPVQARAAKGIRDVDAAPFKTRQAADVDVQLIPRRVGKCMWLSHTDRLSGIESCHHRMRFPSLHGRKGIYNRLPTGF